MNCLPPAFEHSIPFRANPRDHRHIITLCSLLEFKDPSVERKRISSCGIFHADLQYRWNVGAVGIEDHHVSCVSPCCIGQSAYQLPSALSFFPEQPDIFLPGIFVDFMNG